MIFFHTIFNPNLQLSSILRSFSEALVPKIAKIVRIGIQLWALLAFLQLTLVAQAQELASNDGVSGQGQGRTTSSRVSEVEESTYSVRLQHLEQRVNELKEQVFRSKARLSLLAETVLQGVVSGSQALIVHNNKMSSSFKLVKAVYALDGAPIFNRSDEEGSLSENEEFAIYNGSIVPGEHTLTVNLEYRGHGYGIFTYLEGYRFRVRSSYSFSAPEGKIINIQAVGFEKGGPTLPLEERPAVRYQEHLTPIATMDELGGGSE
jgi:hypothetical protein